MFYSVLKNMEQLPPIPRLSEMINEIINDPIEAKLIAFKFKRLPVSQAVKKMALLENRSTVDF